MLLLPEVLVIVISEVRAMQVYEAVLADSGDRTTLSVLVKPANALSTTK